MKKFTVATSKAQAAIESMRPYQQRLDNIMSRFVSELEGESSSPREPLDPSNEITKFAMSLSPTLYLMNRIRENL